MKQIFILFLFFCLLDGNSQSIPCGNYQLPFESHLDSKGLKKLNLLLKNKDNTVKLVSLEPLCWKEKEFTDSIEIERNVCTFSTVIYNNHSIDTKRFKTSSNISNEDFSSILSIFYQNKTEFSNSFSSLCYEPRHGIIIYNSNGKIKEFFEICFECFQINQFGKLPKINNLTSEDFKQLNRIFYKYIDDYIEEKYKF